MTTAQRRPRAGWCWCEGNEINHGVVLLEFANRLRAEGRPARDAILEAASLRPRPILMTLATSVLGLVPLALNLGEGGDMLAPMAVAVIGGLVFSIFVTLAFLPCSWLLVASRAPRREPAGVGRGEPAVAD